jgi:hypothetical protein
MDCANFNRTPLLTILKPQMGTLYKTANDPDVDAPKYSLNA